MKIRALDEGNWKGFANEAVLCLIKKAGHKNMASHTQGKAMVMEVFNEVIVRVELLGCCWDCCTPYLINCVYPVRLISYSAGSNMARPRFSVKKNIP